MTNGSAWGDLLVVQLFRFRWRPARRRGRLGWLARWWRDVTRWLRWGTRRTTGEYTRFMQSPAWRAQRRRVLRRDAYRCRACGGRGQEVHHHWYAGPAAGGIVATPDDALTTLCPACHLRIHRNKQSAPTSRRLW